MWVPGEDVQVLLVAESQGLKDRDRFLHVTSWMLAENIVERKTRPGETVFENHSGGYLISWEMDVML